MTGRLSVDIDRLDRYRAAADAARGEARRERERVDEARRELMEAEEQLRDAEREPAGRGLIGNPIHDEKVRLRDRRVEGARSRVNAAQEELARRVRNQSECAAARENATQLFAKLERYAKENAKRGVQWP